MSINNDGFSGVDIEQIALEKNVLVGLQCPNMLSSVKYEINGQTLPEASISKDGGMSIEPVFGLSCSCADTSWLSHGGIYSVSSGNKMNFTTGGGGFEFLAFGPMKTIADFVDFNIACCVKFKTQLFTVSATERAHIMGKRIDFDFDETYFTGNINFINNIAMNGSLFINGEFFCSHMTTMGQPNRTAYSSDLSGYINPGQSFVAFNGASKKAGELQPAVECLLTLDFPDPIGKLLTLPCKLQFINGISFASDATIVTCPDTVEAILAGSTRPCDEKTSDLMGSGHDHEFFGPSCSYANTTSDVYSEAKDMMDSLTPTKAKPTIPNGCSSWQDFINQCKEAATNATTNFVTNSKNYIWNIFPNKS